MEKGVIFAGAGLLIMGIIVFLANYFSKKAIVRRHLRKAVLKEIGRVTDGETVKISGKVELIGEPLTAPLSGRKCAYYHARVEQLVSTGKSSTWKEIIDEEVSGAFGIRDGRSCARIESPRIESYILDDRKYKSGIFNEPSAVLEEFLNRHGKKSEDFMGFNKSLRFTEGVLDVGERVAALGLCKWRHAESGEWSDEFGKVLIIGPSGKMPVYLSDE